MATTTHAHKCSVCKDVFKCPVQASVVTCPQPYHCPKHQPTLPLLDHRVSLSEAEKVLDRIVAIGTDCGDKRCGECRPAQLAKAYFAKKKS